MRSPTPIRPANRVPTIRTVQALVAIGLDLDLLASIAQHRGAEVDRVLAEVVSDLECRLHDAIRWRHGVCRVGIATTADPDRL